ncbi:MAG: helix-turn-helix domain-containing protein [Clostridiales bacterium]|nr:helix-turn-helix domain-containing protein [Clostridiales bacterium]
MYRRIRDLREDADLSQRQIAEILHMHKTTYTRYETGEREIPFSVAISLAKHYRVSLDYIAGLTDSMGAK